MRNALAILSAMLLSAGCASVQTQGGLSGVVAPGTEAELVRPD